MAFFQCAIVGQNAAGEAFRMGINVDSGSGLGESSAAVVAGHIATNFTTKFTASIGGATLAEKYHTSTSFQKVVVYERPRDPSLPSIDIAEAPLTGLVGSTPTNPLPPETAVCVSFLTGVPGRSNRGRMYLPAPHSGLLTTSGRLVSTSATFFASWAAQLLSGINGSIDGGDVVVWSRKGASTKNVTQVLVGDQFDVQRRRQNATPETYVSASVSA